VSRFPEIAYLQKQSTPSEVGDRQSGAFASLAQFLGPNLRGWISEYVAHRLGPRRAFRDYSAASGDLGVYALEGDPGDGEVRVALAGDWGAGTDEAFEVGRQIEGFDPHYAIHLGDIYFVGDRAEARENFLGVPNPKSRFRPCRWPDASKGRFALNGNHEMFARGIGYFDEVLPSLGLKNRPGGQNASFFCLENDRWRIIGLDTGYNSIGVPFLENLPLFQPDCALPDPLVAWLNEVVFAREDRRGVVFLSHHQVYSRFDAWYPRQAEQVAPFVKQPVLWFWGHEHRMAVYEPFQVPSGVMAHGRCIGHGGMPIEAPQDEPHPQCRTIFLDSREYPNEEGLKVGYNGFARLVFRGPALDVDYVDLEGAIVFKERFTVDDAGLLTRSP